MQKKKRIQTQETVCTEKKYVGLKNYHLIYGYVQMSFEEI